MELLVVIHGGLVLILLRIIQIPIQIPLTDPILEEAHVVNAVLNSIAPSN